jgi:hypothetical protein
MTGFVYRIKVDNPYSQFGGPSVQRHHIMRRSARFLYVSRHSECVEADGAVSTLLSAQTLAAPPFHRLDRAELDRAGQVRSAGDVWYDQSAYETRRPELAQQWTTYRDVQACAAQRSAAHEVIKAEHAAGDHTVGSRTDCGPCRVASWDPMVIPKPGARP